MKANFSFKTDLFDSDVKRITVYADDEKTLHRVSDALGHCYCLTNVYISEDKKKSED